MPKDQRTFTKEFKVEAVRLVQTSGKSMVQIARNLVIADSTLYNWCKQHSEQGDHTDPASGHPTEQEEQVRRLKRELESITMQVLHSCCCVLDVHKPCRPCLGRVAHKRDALVSSLQGGIRALYRFLLQELLGMLETLERAIGRLD